jgi:hypothetical protein
MNMKPPRLATIAGEADVDHAIAMLVLAFGTDPVARWMYDDPHQYLLHIPRLFRASEQVRLKQEQRSAPTTALGSRSGSHRAFLAMTARLRRLLPGASKRKSKPTSPPSSSERNIIGPPSPIGVCRSSVSNLYTGTRGVVRHY